MLRRRLPVLVITLAIAAAAPAAAFQSGGSISYPEEPFSWKDRARLVMDHDSLGPALRAGGYQYEARYEMYAAEIVDGVGEPALVMFDAGQGAFSQNFWPASSVKLLAAVAAMEFASGLGFDGSADLNGPWMSGKTIRSLATDAVRWSHGPSYDVLVRVASVDFINLVFASAHGLDSLTIGSDLSGLPVLESPSYSMTRWIDVWDIPVPYKITIPARPASRSYRSNNIDLFDLAEVARRVLLHDEIPQEHRFGISIGDRAVLVDSLCSSNFPHFRYGAARKLGDGAVTCGKSGWWEHPTDGDGNLQMVDGEPAPPSCVDVALVTDTRSGRMVLMAGTGGCFGDGLASMAGPALDALARLPGTRLQTDAGLEMVVDLQVAGDELVVTIATDAQSALVSIDDGSPAIVVGRDGRLTTTVDLPRPGRHVLVVRGRTFGVDVGYRAVDFVVEG